MKTKISEAQDILAQFGLPKSQQNEMAALTLLALCGIKPNDSWRSAKRKSLPVVKGIMNFIKMQYNKTYQVGTRESIRTKVLHPFIDYKIADHNPDNPQLAPQSSNSHYAISEIALDAIKEYGSDGWRMAVELFRKKQINEKRFGAAFIQKLSIKNYKSIVHEEIELGRVNVFIGSNGCGKSNILEAIAMVAASKANDLDNDGLYNRGVRIAKPALTFSSFMNNPVNEVIEIELQFKDEDSEEVSVKSSFVSTNPEDIFSKWIDRENLGGSSIDIRDALRQIPSVSSAEAEPFANMTVKEFLNVLDELMKEDAAKNNNKYNEILSDFLIYSINTKALRGIQAESRKQPLGINGEGLDVLISTFGKEELVTIDKYGKYISWLSKVLVDKGDTLKFEGHKLGKSTSTLYFTDRFMHKRNNTLSAENTNEGILHFLFYIALFVSKKTPSIFGIDNIETALNPRLCRQTLKEIAQLSKVHSKQVFITTHNPAVLDGLNLHDDEQRLFVVSRNSEGITRVKRLKLKPETAGQPLMLSELWVKGVIGGIPQDF